MPVSERLDSLRLRHAALETKLHDELLRPHPDDMELAKLKREKLKLKDEIARLAHDA